MRALICYPSFLIRVKNLALAVAYEKIIKDTVTAVLGPSNM